MTSPAVVILTEPAHCELAGAKVLLQALLQVQQLSEAGIPVSQAFCDHPAEAMKFIDAYAKAYAELQAQSPGLPPPEHLYSMIADGRLSPLPTAPTTPDHARLEEAGQPHPLYVLSLGKPEVLMQALQNNQLAHNSIRLVEIAPLEDSNADSVSVAAAVGARTLASPSWLGEIVAASRADEQGSLPLEGSANEPLKLESVEPSLDHIQIDENNHRTLSAAAIVVDTARVTPTAVDAGTDRVVRDKAPTAATEPAAAAAEPVAEARDTAWTEQDPAPRAGGGTKGSNRRTPDERGPPGEPDPAPGEAPDAPATDPGNSDQADGSGRKSDAVTRPGGRARGDGDQPDGSIDDPDASDDPAEVADITARHQRDGTGDIHSFSDPSGDVLYPPSSSFVSDEDLFYSLPAGGAYGAGIFDGFPGLSIHDDVVDLDAFSRHLPDLIDDPGARPDHLDPILTRPPGLGNLVTHSPPGPNAQPDAPVRHYPDRPDPDHDAARNDMIAFLHDLDV